VSPRNFTVDWRSIPAVPSNTCTTTMSFDESRTWPLFRDPSGRPTSTSSPYPTHSVFSTKISGPAISVMVRYSVGISGSPQSFELVVHLGDRLPELFVEFRFVLHPRQEFAGLQRRRSEEHTSELQSRFDLVCRLLLEKKKDAQTPRCTPHS